MGVRRPSFIPYPDGVHDSKFSDERGGAPGVCYRPAEMRLSQPPWLFVCAATPALGCASAPEHAKPQISATQGQEAKPGETATEAHADTSADTTTETATEPDFRSLAPHATFAALVDAARMPDETRRTDSDAGCLLAGETRFPFPADVLVAARPPAAAQAPLTSTLEEAAGPPTVLSAWGMQPGEALDLSLVAFTTTSASTQQRPVLALFLTAQGIYARGASPEVRAQPKAMTLDQASALLASIPTERAPVVYVSAEAKIPLSDLRALLRALPASFEAALAVALPKGSRLPAPTAPSQTESGDSFCPNGLPAPAASEREGDLSAEALRAAIPLLRDAVPRCAADGGARAALGGKLTLSLRIDEAGRVRHACLAQDEIGEPLLRRCIAQSAREISFAVPSPAGSVDLELPLALAAGGPAAQRPICE